MRMLQYKSSKNKFYMRSLINDIRLLRLLRIVLKNKGRKHIKPRHLIMQLNMALQHHQGATWYYVNPGLLQLLKFFCTMKYIYNFFLVPHPFYLVRKEELIPAICIIYLYTLGKNNPHIIFISQRHKQISTTYKNLQQWHNSWRLQTTILTTPKGYM